MKTFHRIVPVSCVASMLVLSGCDRSDTTAANVKPASQQTPAAKAQPEASAETKAAQAPTPSLSSEAPVDLAASPGTDVARAQAPFQGEVSTVQIVKAEPANLDMGDIATNDSKSAKVKLINTGDKPMTVVSARASCGCTALKFVPNTVIPPQESIEVDVQLNGGPRAGAISGKTVTFVVEGQPEVIVPLKAMAVSYVVTEPSVLDPDAMPEGKFMLKAIDGQPFRIVSTQPQVVETFDSEAKSEHELTVSWAKYREIGISRQLLVYLDHPKCQQVNVQVNFKPEEIVRQNAEDQKRRELNNQAIQKNPQSVPAPLDPNAMLANMIKEGRNVEVLQRLQTGLDVNYRDDSGNSLLGMAAKAGNTDLVKSLLATGKVEIESTDNVGRTALMHAGTSKNVETVRVLIDAGANPSTRDNLGTTALSWAAWLGDAASVQELIDAGSDVEVVGTITGWTPLILAAGFGDPGAIDALIDAHANIEAMDMLEGATPLIHAARTGKVEGVKALIKRGANLENPDRNGNTPLLACAKTSGGDAVKLQALIEAGADIQAKDNRGLNALELARKRTDIRAPEVIAILEPLLASAASATPAESANASISGTGAADHAGHDHN